MTSDTLHAVLGPEPLLALGAAFILTNLAAGAAIATVALVRLPVRRLFGPAAAYRLWLIPPALGFIALLSFFMAGDSQASPTTMAATAAASGLGRLIVPWAVGAAAVAGAFALAQARFLAQVRAGRAGPAVVGFISPRIVLPAEDAGYTAAERALIRAHEREHVARKDPRAAALAAVAQCLCWFNPLVHLAAHLVRLDQELACDAAVILSRPTARALYARTLMKTQLAASPLPFGCYWPARGKHPLEVRIALLKWRSDRAPAGSGAAVVPPTVDAIRP